MTFVNQLQPHSDKVPLEFGDAINTFIHEAEQFLQAQPGPVVFWAAGTTHVQGQLGYSVKDGSAAVRSQIKTGQPFWLIAGRRSEPPLTIRDWVAERGYQVVMSQRCRSDDLPRHSGWPGMVALYRVQPLPP